MRTWRLRRLIRRGDEARGNDWSAAAEAYGRALTLDPSLHHIRIQLGHARAESGDLQGAVRTYGEAARLEPDRSEPLTLLGEAAKRMGRFDLAARLHLMASARPDFDEDQRDLFLNVSVEGERVDAVAAAALGRVAAGPIVEALLHGSGRGVPARTGSLILDVSDLVRHLARYDALSGIQRVQASVAAALDEVACPGSWSPWVYAPRRREWVALARDELAALTGIVSGYGPTGAAADEVRSNLFAALSVRPAAEASAGCVIVDLGASWLLDGHLDAVLSLKRSWGVGFAPFIHDLIPIVAPAYSDLRTRQAFARWIAGLAGVADRWLANSLNTKADLLRVAADLGVPVAAERIEVVRLDADFGGDARPPCGVRVLSPTGGFALMTSTFEERKNHRLVFEAWDRLVRRHGGGAVPRLVCVGRATGDTEAILSDLRRRPGLAEVVTIRHDVSDAELDALHRDSLFSVYPSAYEGWGLPVTEALIRGRVPVVARNSSLVEAGGEWALYFETGSVESLLAAVERAAFDDPWRREREGRIGRTFRPRRWTDIARQILGFARSMAAAGTAQAACSRTPAASSQPIE